MKIVGLDNRSICPRLNILEYFLTDRRTYVFAVVSWKLYVEMTSSNKKCVNIMSVFKAVLIVGHDQGVIADDLPHVYMCS